MGAAGPVDGRYADLVARPQKPVDAMALMAGMAFLCMWHGAGPTGTHRHADGNLIDKTVVTAC